MLIYDPPKLGYISHAILIDIYSLTVELQPHSFGEVLSGWTGQLWNAQTPCFNMGK